MRLWPLVISFSVLVLLFLLCVVFRGVEISRPPGWLPRCAVFQLTGIHCPGCGNTRAAHALLHGDVAEAVRQNAFTVIVLPAALVLALQTWWNWIVPGARWKPLLHPQRWHFIVVLTLLLLFTLLRNLPWAPFSWLAPDPPKVRESPESEAPVMPTRSDPPPAVP